MGNKTASTPQDGFTLAFQEFVRRTEPSRARKNGQLVDFAREISRVTKLEISKQRVSHWRKSGIPLEFCKAVAQLTGVPREKLRPDVFD